MEDGMEIPLKTWNKLPYDPPIQLLDIYPEEIKIEKDTCISLLITALFTIAEHGSNLDLHRQMNG